ncbi:MAG: hypothetical protein C4527_13075 [Candidatus Omnitrophota bacterium]|jgi:hypothetical protein|nr:MAG: hypothetical protein C4527_13075 [Candidatus Omnitrophota bacterium]
MKKYFTLLVFFLVPLCAIAQTPKFTYVTEFQALPEFGPTLAVAVDSHGGLYFLQFSSPNPNMTACIYVADPLNANSANDLILVDDAIADTNVPSGRGMHGLTVDSKGNVYIALESGANTTATIRKLSPAPEFKPVDEFGGGVVWPEKRYTGLDIMNDDILIAITWTDVDFWNAHDPYSPFLHSLTGGQTYQRDCAYNPNTGDIYLSRNRGLGVTPVDSCSVVRGGSANNLAGYTQIEMNFIPQGGIGGEYGAHNQKIGYDAVNDFIMIPDYERSQHVMAFYRPSDLTNPVTVIDTTDSPNGPTAYPTDAAAYTNSKGETYVFITTWTDKRILIYQLGEVTDVWGWDLF